VLYVSRPSATSRRYLASSLQLAEPYLYSQDGAPQRTDAQGIDHWLVPTGQLFVTGDHRAVSADSRASGTVPTSFLIGRAWLRYLPLGTFGIVANPSHPELASPSPSLSCLAAYAHRPVESP